MYPGLGQNTDSRSEDRNQVGEQNVGEKEISRQTELYTILFHAAVDRMDFWWANRFP